MALEFVRTFPALSEAHLAAFQLRYGIRLPAPFAEFLLANNGGIPKDQRFVSKYHPRAAFVIRKFLPIAERQDVGFENLDTFMKTYKIDQHRLPLRMIPVASDMFGNLFCLSASGSDSGKVYFWDHEAEPSDVGVEGDANIRLVADDFAEFVRGLQPL